MRPLRDVYKVTYRLPDNIMLSDGYWEVRGPGFYKSFTQEAPAQRSASYLNAAYRCGFADALAAVQPKPKSGPRLVKPRKVKAVVLTESDPVAAAAEVLSKKRRTKDPMDYLTIPNLRKPK